MTSHSLGTHAFGGSQLTTYMTGCGTTRAIVAATQASQAGPPIPPRLIVVFTTEQTTSTAYATM